MVSVLNFEIKVQRVAYWIKRTNRDPLIIYKTSTYDLWTCVEQNWKDGGRVSLKMITETGVDIPVAYETGLQFKKLQKSNKIII